MHPHQDRCCLTLIRPMHPPHQDPQLVSIMEQLIRPMHPQLVSIMEQLIRPLSHPQHRQLIRRPPQHRRLMLTQHPRREKRQSCDQEAPCQKPWLFMQVRHYQKPQLFVQVGLMPPHQPPQLINLRLRERLLSYVPPSCTLRSSGLLSCALRSSGRLSCALRSCIRRRCGFLKCGHRLLFRHPFLSTKPSRRRVLCTDRPRHSFHRFPTLWGPPLEDALVLGQKS